MQRYPPTRDRSLRVFSAADELLLEWAATTTDCPLTVVNDPFGALALLSQGCEFYDAAECAGALVGERFASSALEDSGGVWSEFEVMFNSPAGALSALCTIETGVIGSDPMYDLFVDALFLTAGDTVIFIDGFESGDTTAWSSTTP